MLQGLYAQDKDIQVFAARNLAAMAREGAPIVARLTAILGEPAPRARWGAAYALSLIDGALDLNCLPAIGEAMRTPDGDVRWAAVTLMVRLGTLYPAQIHDHLLRLMADADPGARKMALYTLRDLDHDGPALLAAIDSACDDPDSQVRLAVLALLRQRLSREDGTSRHAEIGMVLKLLETDSDGGVRRTAAAVLASLSDFPPPVRGALARAAASSDPTLRKIAVRALNRQS